MEKEEVIKKEENLEKEEVLENKIEKSKEVETNQEVESIKEKTTEAQKETEQSEEVENHKEEEHKEVEIAKKEENIEEQKETEKFEEVEVYQEVELIKKKVRTDSYFDGSLIELIGWKLLAFLITIVSFGIAGAWGKCMIYSYKIKHTVYNGKRLKFEGTGGDLFVNRFKWALLTIITFGIYALFIPIKKTKWVISNIHFEDEEFKKEESFFDGNTIQLIGINLLCTILNIVTLGLLAPFTTCLKLRWIIKHTVINRKKLVFKGRAIGLFGKQMLWNFLTIITFGIFALWLPIKIMKWKTKHTHIKVVGEEEKKDKSLFMIKTVDGLFFLVVL